MASKSIITREHIFNSLLKDILRGDIHPGEKLLESELGKKFNVSRTPVREAILQLEKEGLVEYKRNIGCFVKKISREETEEILDLVSLLEGYAAKLVAAQNLDKKDISYLRSLLAEMKKYGKQNDYFKYIKKNREFHYFFPKRCGNKSLNSTVSNLRDRVHRRTRYLGLTLSKHIHELLKDHEKIIDAVSKQNPLEAEKHMKNHVQKSKKFIIEALDQLGMTEGI